VLEHKIQTGELRGGQWLPSERMLAEEFGVSRAIVRDAVRTVAARGLLVTSARCRPVVRSERVPTRHAAVPSLAPTRRRSVALLVWPNPSWPGSAMLVQGIRQALGADEFRLVLETASGEDWEEVRDWEARFLRRLAQEHDIEGLILWYLGGPDNLPALEAVRAAGIPMVFVDRRPPAGFDADFAGVDNAWSAEEAVRHLIALGHRSISHVSNLDRVSTVEERLAGYRRALERAGIPFRPELVRRDAGTGADEHEAGCGALVDELMALPTAPTAVFAVNDIVAHHVVAALRSRGRRVPDDVSVVGFDGVERWETGAPFLTTVEQPFTRLGTAAAELLRERINRQQEGSPLSSSYRHILLDAPLIVRGSTARRSTPEEPRIAAP
jgi:LacI family transcriptional regulator